MCPFNSFHSVKSQLVSSVQAKGQTLQKTERKTGSKVATLVGHITNTFKRGAKAAASYRL